MRAAFGLCLLFPLALRAADDVQKDREKRLDACASDMQNVQIHKVDKQKPTARDGRISGHSAELHVRFQPTAAGADDDTKAALMIIPIQCSGYTAALGPQNKRTSGSDVVRCTVKIADFLDTDTERPKAKIDVPEVRHGSPYDAVSLIRDEIQRRLQQFLPEIDIDGPQLFYEKRLKIANAADEPITVWVQYHTRDLKARPIEWVWKPGRPQSADAIRITIGAKSDRLVVTGEALAPIRASQVYVWAESESGEVWDTHRRESLWLVDANPKLAGSRAYREKEIGTHTHTFKPSDKPRLFTERVLSLKNKTPEELRVKLRYFSNRDGHFGWRTASVSIPPQASVAPRSDDGERIRAAQLYVTAESENRRFQKYADEALWTVAETNNQRAYLASKIGTFEHVFEPTAAAVDSSSNASGAPRQVRVVRNGAAVFSGSTQITTLTAGQPYAVLGQNGAWLLIQVNVNGQSRQGWVSQADVASSSP